MLIRRGRLHFASTVRRAFSTDTETFTLHGFEHSQPVRSVLLLLQENSIKHDMKVLNPVKGETRTAEYRKINPTGLVPCLVHHRPNEEDFAIGEASAILQYLCNLSQTGPVGGSALIPKQLASFYPPAGSTSEARARARVDFWLSWHHHNTRVCTLKVFHPYVFRKMYANYPGGYEAPLKEGLKSTARSLSLLDQHFASSGTRFLTNSTHPTIADLLLLPDVDQLLPEAYNVCPTLRTDYPNVARWMERCADPAQGGLRCYAANFGKVQEAGQQYQLRQKQRQEEGKV